MRIDIISNYEKKLIYNEFYFRKINFTDNKFVKLIDGITDEHKEKILDTLNTINNQNIQDIFFEKYQYMHRDNILGFSKFSKAERVFLVACLAEIKKQEVWVHTDITQLTRTTLKKFIRLFKDSPYVNIVYDSEHSKAFFNAMIREATND